MKPLLKKKNITQIIIIATSIVLAIFFTFLFSHKKIGELTITVHEESNPDSTNNQCRIKSVIGGSGNIYDLSTLASEDGWEYDADSRELGYYGGDDRTIILNCSEESVLDLHFQKQGSSGIITIEGENIRTENVDLYNSEWLFYNKVIKGETNFAVLPIWFVVFIILFKIINLGYFRIHKLNNNIWSFGVLLFIFETCFALLFFGAYPEQKIILDSSDIEHIRYKGFDETENGWLSNEGDPYIVINFDKATRVKNVHISMEYMSEQDLWGQIFILDSYEKDSLSFWVGDNKVDFPAHFKSKYKATGVRLDVVSKAGATVQPKVVTINETKDVLKTVTKYAVLLWSIIVLIYTIKVFFHKLSYNQKHKLSFGILFFINPAVVIWAVEQLDGFAIRIDKLALFGTYLFIVALETIILALIRRIDITVIISDITCVLIGLVNYYVTEFRGVPLALSDIFSINTALDVAGEYQINITFHVILCVLVVTLMTITSIVYFKKFKENRFQFKIQLRVLSVVVSILIINCVFKFINVIDMTNTLAVANKYDDSGVILGVMSSMPRINKPNGYSAQLAEEVMAETITDTVQTETKTPNIIMIMNESFADLSVLGDFQTNKEVLPYFNSLSENVIKGYCAVSVFGGGTCNSEYEVLTGNSMAFFPKDSYPYNQYCKGNVSGMASYLRDLGYYCIAEHPAPAGNYNRESVYRNMGFDETIFEDDFTDPEIVRYTSDWTTYEKIIDKISEVEEPLFMLDITMQNHGGYGTSTDWEEPIRLIDMNYPNTEEYLSAVHVSDKALQRLLEKLQECDEPTYVLFFGDHLPNTADGFVENMLFLSGNDVHMKYFTPFVIWSNVEMETQTNVITSTNYLGEMLLNTAGVQLPRYFEYLTEIQKKIPVITSMGYQDTEHNWYELEQDNEYKDLINNYNIVQYYNFKNK